MCSLIKHQEDGQVSQYHICIIERPDTKGVHQIKQMRVESRGLDKRIKEIAKNFFKQDT